MKSFSPDEITLAKVVVGSQLHRTATPSSDWDYRGIYVENPRIANSPFRQHKTTSWVEGDQDNTSYELREFCKLATKGNATILEVFFSDMIIDTSKYHKEMQENWRKFMDTHNFIAASRGYATNQYKKALSYDDLGEKGQVRTAKFIISFIRVMWQCEQFLLTGHFNCSLETCDMYDFIKEIKGKAREDINVSLCFSKMESLHQRLYKAEEHCKNAMPNLYGMKPDVKYIEDFIYRTYKEVDNEYN